MPRISVNYRFNNVPAGNIHGGDSGGGIINQSGELVSIVSRAGDERTMGSALPKYKTWYTAAMQRFSNVNAADIPSEFNIKEITVPINGSLSEATLAEGTPQSYRDAARNDLVPDVSSTINVVPVIPEKEGFKHPLGSSQGGSSEAVESSSKAIVGSSMVEGIGNLIDGTFYTDGSTDVNYEEIINFVENNLNLIGGVLIALSAISLTGTLFTMF